MFTDLEYYLISAARIGDLERLRECVIAGVDLDTMLANGDTALHVAMNWGHIEAIKFLISEGANPDILHQKGRTLLMRAADGGYLELATFLLDHGASPNLADPHYRLTPLMRAAVRGQIEMVQLLLEAGADATMRDTDKKTAQDKAHLWGRTQIAELLKETRISEEQSREGFKPKLALENTTKYGTSTDYRCCRCGKDPGTNLIHGKRYCNDCRPRSAESPNTTSSYKNKLREAAQNALRILAKFPDLDSVFLPDAGKRREIKDILQTSKKDLQQALKRVVDEAEWDRVNIGFYGQTNSGKSTVIESLIGGDGTGIGEGYKDFTKHVKDLNYGNLALLDMPGIEGKEADVREEIGKALRKTHVVFFINGTNKEPDQPVLKKIADDLASEAKIYSIINVRGKPSAYRDVKGLLTGNLQKLEARILGLLGKSFGKRYQGNFTVQAYLAFLARGRPIREDLVKDQGKLGQVFKPPSTAFEFSRMATVRQAIDNLAKDGLKEIAIANTLKLLEPLETSLDRLYQKREELQTIVDNLESEVSAVVSECSDIFQKCNQKIEDKVNRRIEDMKAKMTKKVYQGIDEGWSESRIRKEIEQIHNSTHAEICNQLNQRISEMKNDIDILLQAFKRRLELEFKFSEFSVDLPIDDILKKLDRDVDYYLRELWDVLKRMFWALPTLLVNVPVAVMTAIVIIIRKFCDFFFGDPAKRKREAKQDAYSKIHEAISKIKNDAQSKMNSQRRQLQKSVTDPLNMIKEHPKYLKNFLVSFGVAIAELARVVAETSGALLRHLSVKSFDKAYIGVKAEEICLIGNGQMDTDGALAKLSDVLVYPTTQKVLESCPHRIENGTLFLGQGKDLLFWALTAFSADLGIQSVRRE